MEVEIELKSADLAGDIYELRKYLEENIEGLRLEIKTQPAHEGQMIIEEVGIGILHGILEGVGKESGKLMVEGGKKIISLIKEWAAKKKKTGTDAAGIQSLGPGVSVDNGSEKVYITEDEKGSLQVYDNFNFAINANNTYALLVGISEFEGDFPPIPPIRNNLVDFYNLLVDKRHIGLPRKNVQVVFNKTDHEIAETMLGVSRIPGMETLIIYYSGHGHKSDVKSLTLTARNTKKIGDVILGGIDLGFVTDKVLRPSTASQKILILDACHSGIAAQGDDDVLRLVDVKGTYTLTSSGDEASYFDKHAQNTFFTGAMLDMLRNGVDDASKEMISLEDIYQSSSQKLAANKFPKPNRKSEMNIPAADFLLARNPSFSADKLKQKAALLKKQGKLQEANHEYIILLNRYPDDEQLRKQAEQCRADLRFAELVDEGDEAYFTLKDYRKALEKYKEASKIKDDVTVATRISKCEEFLRTAKANTDNRKEQAVIPVDQRARHETEKKVTQKPVDYSRPASVPVPSKKESVIHVPVDTEQNRQPADKRIWIIIALAWIGLSMIFLWFTTSVIFSRTSLEFTERLAMILRKACLPSLVIAALIIILKNKTISPTEVLIYIIGALPSTYLLALMLSHDEKSLALPAFLFLVQAIAYIVYFRKSLYKFSILEFVMACFPLLYLLAAVSVFILLELFANEKNDDVVGPIALGFGGLLAAVIIFLFYRIRKKTRRA